MDRQSQVRDYMTIIGDEIGETDADKLETPKKIEMRRDNIGSEVRNDVREDDYEGYDQLYDGLRRPQDEYDNNHGIRYQALSRNRENIEREIEHEDLEVHPIAKLTKGENLKVKEASDKNAIKLPTITTNKVAGETSNIETSKEAASHRVNLDLPMALPRPDSKSKVKQVDSNEGVSGQKVDLGVHIYEKVTDRELPQLPKDAQLMKQVPADYDRRCCSRRCVIIAIVSSVISTLVLILVVLLAYFLLIQNNDNVATGTSTIQSSTRTLQFSTVKPSKATPVSTFTGQCLQCLCEVEGCKAGSCFNDTSEVYCGPFHITQSFWIDCGQMGTSFEACAKEKECSFTCMRAYMKRYGTLCTSGRQPTCRDYSLIYKGGPKGCRAAYPTYWNLVKACCDRYGGC